MSCFVRFSIALFLLAPIQAREAKIIVIGSEEEGTLLHYTGLTTGQILAISIAAIVLMGLITLCAMALCCHYTFVIDERSVQRMQETLPVNPKRSQTKYNRKNNRSFVKRSQFLV